MIEFLAIRKFWKWYTQMTRKQRKICCDKMKKFAKICDERYVIMMIIMLLLMMMTANNDGDDDDDDDDVK